MISIKNERLSTLFADLKSTKVRVTNAFKMENAWRESKNLQRIETVGDLARVDPTLSIMDIPNLGKKCIAEIVEVLKTRVVDGKLMSAEDAELYDMQSSASVIHSAISFFKKLNQLLYPAPQSSSLIEAALRVLIHQDPTRDSSTIPNQLLDELAEHVRKAIQEGS